LIESDAQNAGLPLSGGRIGYASVVVVSAHAKYSACSFDHLVGNNREGIRYIEPKQ